MLRNLYKICFYTPLVISWLNIQGLISRFISPSLSQMVAYFNLFLLLLGIVLFRKNIGSISKTIGLWFIFFILYYSFGLLASGISGFQSSILATLVPVIYFTSFYFLLSNKKQFYLFFEIITICLVISSFLTIILIKLNIDAYTGEEHKWALDRAGGITGDPNAAAYTSIFAYIFFNQLYISNKYFVKIIKPLILLSLFYSLILTYSTTGLFVFTLVFFLLNYKLFKGIKLLLIIIFIPLFYVFVFTLRANVNDLGLSEAQTAKVNNITNLLTFNFDDVDSSGRSTLIEKAVQFIEEKPIIGNGVDYAVSEHVHNTYIGVWVDSGLFTLLFFIYMLLYLFYKISSVKSQIKVFGMSILITLYIFMISLQSVINQPNLIVLFAFVGYLADNGLKNKTEFDQQQYDRINL